MPKRRPLRVGMFVYTEYLSDPRVRREAEALAARGDLVEVLCLRQPPYKGETYPTRWFTECGVRVCQLPMRKYQGGNALEYLLRYISFTLMGAVWLTGLQVRRRYDVIQIHTMPDFLIFAALIPRLLGARLILDMHDLTSDLYAVKFRARWGRPIVWGLRRVERLCAALAQRVITVHEPYRQVLIERGVSASKVAVVMNVPDDRLFAARPHNVPEKKPYHPFTLVYHGAIVPRYGLDVAFRAVARLVESSAAGLIHLNIYGAGEDVPRLRELAQELAIESFVTMPGTFVPTEQLSDLLRTADLAVVPNLANPFTENVLPTKLMEYAALGIPAVVARTGVVGHYFAEDMVAYFPPGDDNALAERIAALAQNPALRRELARQTQLRFTQRFGWDATRQEYYAIVDSVCGRAIAPAMDIVAPGRAA